MKITRRYIVSLDLAALQDRSKQRIHEAILGKSQVLGSDLVLEAFEVSLRLSNAHNSISVRQPQSYDQILVEYQIRGRVLPLEQAGRVTTWRIGHVNSSVFQSNRISKWSIVVNDCRLADSSSS